MPRSRCRRCSTRAFSTRPAPGTTGSCARGAAPRAKMRAIYGLVGDARLFGHELDWLPGYEQSRPVRVGNAAATQLQLDVYGELIDMMFLARSGGIMEGADTWSLQRQCLNWL